MRLFPADCAKNYHQSIHRLIFLRGWERSRNAGSEDYERKKMWSAVHHEEADGDTSRDTCGLYGRSILEMKIYLLTS